MPSKPRSATVPPEPADSATTDAVEPNEGDVADLFDSPPPSITDVFYGDTTPPRTQPDEDPPTVRTYRARQTVYGPNGRVRTGELVQVSPDSGLARSPFLVLVEDPAPPDVVAAAFDEAG